MSLYCNCHYNCNHIISIYLSISLIIKIIIPKGWVRIIHDRNKKRANYIRKVRVTVNIIPPDSPTSFALILPLLTSVKEVKKQFVKRMTGQRQKTMKKALQDSLLIMKSIDGILMKDEETLFPMVKKNSTVKLQYI